MFHFRRSRSRRTGPRRCRPCPSRTRSGRGGSRWAVFGDTASGVGRRRFRFAYPSAPDADGRTSVGFDRTPPTPRAFADHCVCRFSPPGNPLGGAVETGEWDVVRGVAVPSEAQRSFKA
ncbi:DUF1684 domain-containing protein [Streptomyces sp. NPDC005402]|uniref:DUF1684 domain-containing protein n=1 Tax=Streptomyces sp. NPDC005402 TaxID=3155338 RepID=UPI0033AE544E